MAAKHDSVAAGKSSLVVIISSGWEIRLFGSLIKITCCRMAMMLLNSSNLIASLMRRLETELDSNVLHVFVWCTCSDGIRRRVEHRLITI